MQPLVTPERASLTSAQVIDLIQNTPAPIISAGAEIVDLSLNVLEDISGDLAGGSVSRNSYADLHASASLQITRDLDWGADLIRPYYVMSNGLISARFNLGVYHVNTPDRSLTALPITYDVTGYDMLLRLSKPVGDAYSIAAGDNYLAVVESILLARGYTQYVIDQSRAATVAPGPRAWVLDDTTTWLTIVNNLLASIGYQGIWADWDGRLRCEPYIVPQDRDIEWTYSTDPATTMLSNDRTISRDYFDAPNRWVFYRTNLADGTAPVEGDGIWTYQNDSIGDTSVEARGGLVITKTLGIDAADQAALMATGQITIAADMDIPEVHNVKSFPNPLHWHFDKITLLDPSGSYVNDAQCTSWDLQLPPSLDDMQQNWTIVSH